MKLEKLLKNVDVDEIVGNTNINIKSLGHDSKNVEKDSMFFCLSGSNFDGHDFALDVVDGGIVCTVLRES